MCSFYFMYILQTDIFTLTLKPFPSCLQYFRLLVLFFSSVYICFVSHGAFVCLTLSQSVYCFRNNCSCCCCCCVFILFRTQNYSRCLFVTPRCAFISVLFLVCLSGLILVSRLGPVFGLILSFSFPFFFSFLWYIYQFYFLFLF